MTEVRPAPPDLGYPATVGACIRRAAELFGSRDYIVLPETRMTFAEADHASRELAVALLGGGLGKGARIGLFHTYGAEFVVAWLAALRIGALVMPFSTLAKPAELRTMLRLGDVQLLLAPRHLLGNPVGLLLDAAVTGLGAERAGPLYLAEVPYLRDVWMSDSRPDWTRRDGSRPAPVPAEVLAAVETEVVPADLAQVTYTSGTAALPKGVVHSHGALVRNSSPEAARWAMRSVGIEDVEVGSVFCAFPFFWVGGSLTLGQALQAGWTVCCLERFEPRAALDLIETERVDRVLAWPSLVQSMRTDESFDGRDAGLMDRVLPAPVTASGVVRHRGMSETMGNWFGIERKVIDPVTGAEVPDGQEGELCVRGFAVMQGYYKQEREDAFDPDGWLHTGDRVVREASTLHFVGRYAELIKTQGANVSPRELEVLLESFGEVRHALVFGMPHPTDEEEVTAVIVLAPGAALAVDDLLARVRAVVSSYKVPTRVEVVPDEDDVPWLPTGKPDKRAMRARLLDRDHDRVFG